jgi:hypothetical protein
MNPEVFDELLESIRESGAIRRGQKKPPRRFVIEAAPCQDSSKLGTGSPLAHWAGCGSAPHHRAGAQACR